MCLEKKAILFWGGEDLIYEIIYVWQEKHRSLPVNGRPALDNTEAWLLM